MDIDTKKQIPVRHDAPYPKITAARPNMDYANILMPAINASISEMTAITSYLYQHWNFNCKYQEIADTVSNMAKVEMMHLDMLGKTIVLLGGCPGFYNNPCNFWSGAAVNDCLDIEEALEGNIRAEEETISNYRKAAYRIRDCHVRALLERIILDEKIHVDVFKCFLKDFS